jgi:hypothetical protein
VLCERKTEQGGEYWKREEIVKCEKLDVWEKALNLTIEVYKYFNKIHPNPPLKKEGDVGVKLIIIVSPFLKGDKGDLYKFRSFKKAIFNARFTKYLKF